MRVLFFNYEYPPLGGGAGNASAFILREYAKIPDLEVDFVTASIDGEYHLEKIGTKVAIHRLPIGKNASNLHFQSQKDLLRYSWAAYQFAKQLLAKNQYDLCHAFFTVPCGYLAYRLRKKYQLPYVVSLRGSDVPGYSDRFTFLYVLLKPLVRRIWQKAAQVVANSQDLKELALKTAPAQKINIIFNGVDIEQFQPDLTKRKAGEFLLTTGATRITHRKGINYLLEAMSQLQDKYPQLKAKIIGDGNARAELEALSRQLGLAAKVEFVGRVPREETFKYYQEAQVFVLPSINEGMSNALLEALGSGLPILSTKTGGAEILIQDGKNGFLFKTKNSQDLVQKLEKLLQNPSLFESMGVASRKKAEEMSWGRVADEYYRLYINGLKS